MNSWDRSRLNFYAGGRLDRAGLRRRDHDWIERLLANPQTRLVPVWRQQSFVLQTDMPHVATLLREAASDLIRGAQEVALLGLEGDPDSGTAYFALEISSLETPETHPLLKEAGHFADIRSVGPLLGQEEGQLLAYARGLMHWHNRHRFCGVCGSPTRSEDAGHQRRCTNSACNTVHFPRTDPAVIMAVTDGERILLGRQASWPPGMRSVLAGFVEPGESLEEAVAREVKEEVGIEVEDVRYHSSQPWPFPASIMLGFNARALSTEIRLSPDEIAEAAWYTRDQLRASPENETFRLPRRDSIARRLVEDWIAEKN
ncbi:MAG TPA: NAD(+) diphosphatase [Hypericibacter adhaerens]|jgi:NAD+ diphosphatase|uniref:NAD(+) diphosphatase n=1 Tax=Hypericibacter adhaerens TaxID=2602016 RepID=UPI002BD0801D|nr:NAD(+) diphosphatase [Hypericibacter adhaerens]HWA46414.1 NAD(+) diphosphatase [Hypericibacter adhaerens]